jgi:nucleolar protein TMA23
MDAQAYLIKHGWSGPGNPLNPTQRPGLHGGLGLTRPILVARKSNNHGVGKKTTKDATNQWWLRGFEDALKGVGDDSFEANSARQNNALTSELYRHFVRGSGLAGTLDPKKESEDKSASASASSSKRKREDGDDSKAGKAARKEERAAKRAQKVAKKEEKAGRKEARRVKRAEKVEKREAKEAGKIAKKAKKAAEKTAEEDYPTPMSIDESEQTEKIDLNEAAARLQKKEKKEKKSTESAADSKKKSKKD